jgi:hypothetical protein
MATASLNIPIEIPNSTVLNLEELKQQLTDYARVLVSQASNKGIRPFKELHPHIQSLCGVVSFPEDDLDGENVRMEYLKEL